MRTKTSFLFVFPIPSWEQTNTHDDM